MFARYDWMSNVNFAILGKRLPRGCQVRVRKEKKSEGIWGTAREWQVWGVKRKYMAWEKWAGAGDRQRAGDERMWLGGGHYHTMSSFPVSVLQWHFAFQSVLLLLIVFSGFNGTFCYCTMLKAYSEWHECPLLKYFHLYQSLSLHPCELGCREVIKQKTKQEREEMTFTICEEKYNQTHQSCKTAHSYADSLFLCWIPFEFSSVGKAGL